jgi:hypothetical protein
VWSKNGTGAALFLQRDSTRTHAGPTKNHRSGRTGAAIPLMPNLVDRMICLLRLISWEAQRGLHFRGQCGQKAELVRLFP